MTTLAINGGKRTVTGVLAPFNTIGKEEEDAAIMALHGGPLSGFLGGRARGGYWVRHLEDQWAEMFGVKYAVACNSATSGLLAAAKAARLGSGDRFICSPYTMSATAAAPALTGATPLFCDVYDRTFGLDIRDAGWGVGVKAVFLTHLFGLAVDERWWKDWCSQNHITLVVDASQAPLALSDDVLAGTVADIGVYSLNVHKHIQCGEGGICVTNNEYMADSLRRFINHGEMCGGHPGLNLRMTELTAAVALAQLRKAPAIIERRVEVAEQILAAIGEIPGLDLPTIPQGSRHVFYTIPFLIESGAVRRAAFIRALVAEGVPLFEGYVNPLYRLPAFSAYARPCPVAEDLHDRRLLYYENCAYDPTPEQIKQIGDAFQKVAEHMTPEVSHAMR